MSSMTEIRFKWKDRNFYKLRNDPKVIHELERRGRQVLNAANATLPERRGYRMSSFQGARKPYGRWFVQVYTSSSHAKFSEAKNNTLLRVLAQTQKITPRRLNDYNPRGE